MKSKTKRNRRRTYPRTYPKVLIAVAALVALVIAGLLIWYFAFGRTTTPDTTTDTGSKDNTTTQEQEGDTDNPVKTDDTQSNGSAGGSDPETTTEASLFIVDASQYDSIFEVRSYVNTLEPGTCTFTFTRGSEKITKQTNTLTNGDTTSCSTLTVNISEFTSSGSWDLVINYLSTANNVSAKTTKTVEIQKG